MPGKKNKKSKPNAFFCYMKAMHPRVEKRLGRKVAFEELSHHLGMEWQSLSKEEKATFGPLKTHIPLDTFGIPLAVHAENAEREKKLKEDMISGINNLVDLHVTGDAIPQLEIVVAATTEYITTEEDEVFPAEISLVRLTIKDGLDPVQYHAILNPPEYWPLGYTASVRELSRKSHCLPTDRSSSDCVGTDDSRAVARQLTAFLEQDDGSGVLVPVYTLEERINITRKVLKERFNMEHVSVWALEELLRTIYESLFPSSANHYTNRIARDELVNAPNSPDMHPALGCKWHREEMCNEINFCSLNMAQRWGYMLLQALNIETSLGIELVPGRHWPGVNPSRGEVVHLSHQQKKKRLRQHMASLSSLNTASQYSLCYSDAATEQQQDDCKSRELPAAGHTRSVSPWRADYTSNMSEFSTANEDFPALGATRLAKGSINVNHVNTSKTDNASKSCDNNSNSVDNSGKTCQTLDCNGCNEDGRIMRKALYGLTIRDDSAAAGGDDDCEQQPGTAGVPPASPAGVRRDPTVGVGKLHEQARGSSTQIAGLSIPTLHLKGVGRGRKMT